MRVSDIADRVSWLLECSESDAQAMTGRDLELVVFLFVADSGEVTDSNGITEIAGKVIKFKQSDFGDSDDKEL
jgi:hypothetical protein